MENNKEYYHGLNQLRAVLMLIGVLIHAAAVISPYYAWNYQSGLYQHGLLHNIVYITHFFRMEAFFLIAGFFSAMVLIKKGKAYFLRGRVLRVLVPLVFSILLINTFEVWFVVHKNITPMHKIGLGDFIVHSWFLLTLMLISLICLLPAEKLLGRLSDWPWWAWLGLLVFYAFLPFGIKFVLNMLLPMNSNPLFYSVYNYVVEKTLYYSIYFFAGYAIYRSEAIRGFLGRPWVKRMMWLAAGAGLAYQFLHIGADKEAIPFAMRAVNVLIQHVSALSVAVLLFDFFLRANFPFHKSTAFLVNAAIIVYLFHHPLVIVLGYYLDMPGLTPLTYFLLLIACAYVLSFGVYFLINSNRATRFMFGLK